MTLIKRLEKSIDFHFLLFSSFLFFLLRLPSLFEPYWYGDEGIYQTIGLALSKGALLYRDIWDNKPPLLYYLYSVFGADQFSLRLVSLIFGIIGIFFLFLLARKIFIKPKIYRSVILIFVFLFGLPLIEGNIANAENFMIPLNIISAYLLFRSIEGKNTQKKFAILSGLLLGISFLIKIVSIFDFAAFFTFLFVYDFPESLNFSNIKNQLIKKIPSLIIFAASFLSPFLLIVIYFLINNAFPTLLTSMFFSNVDYVGYGNKFIIPQGLLIFKLLLLFFSLLLIFLFIKKIKFVSVIFILTWYSFSLFNTFFSQRSYPHYVLVLLPSLCLLFGALFIYTKFSKILFALLLFPVLIILSYFSLYGKNLQYYQNFILFTFDHKSVNSYQSFFDGNTPRDYEIVAFLRMNLRLEDNIFIWGSNAQVYKLVDRIPPGKYTVRYHMTSYPDGIENTRQGLRKSNPKYIILMPGPSYPFSLFNYRPRIQIKGAEIYERNI